MNILLIFFILLIVILIGIYAVLALLISLIVMYIQNRNELFNSLTDSASLSCNCRNRNR